mgnify:CR=1 FL=1
MSARDRIRLAGLSAVGHHGVFDHERRDGQPFVTDVVLHLDAGPAAAGDDLARTANYAEVADTVVRLVTGEPVDLIETLADRIARAVLAEQHDEWTESRRYMSLELLTATDTMLAEAAAKAAAEQAALQVSDTMTDDPGHAALAA